MGGAGFLFALFLLVPLGAPTAHLAPTRSEARTRALRPGPGPRRLDTLAPRGYVAWIERKIVHAGKLGEWTAAGFLGIKLLLTVPLVAGILVYALTAPVAPVLRIGAGVVGILLVLAAPEVILASRADDRQKEISRALPDTLDQMTIAVEAGLGFDSAMAKAVANGKGPLAEELRGALHDIGIGQSRVDAYRALERRTDSPDLRRFIRAVVQAETYGISVAEVLRVQAGEMRIKRRQRAEEQAVKVPVKIVFPLVFCILTVLFIVLLTPAVVGIARTFL